MKTINYKGKGEHSVNDLELIIEQQAEELHLIKSGQKPLIIDSVMPCFEFSNKATKYTENGVTTLAVDTDGIALTNDNLPHQAYTLEEGVKYTVKLYKA